MLEYRATRDVGEIERYDRFYIGGEWVNPIDGGIIESIDPATGMPWATIPVGA